jgi:hypothetical protein
LRVAVAQAVHDPREQPTQRLSDAPPAVADVARPAWRRPAIAAAAGVVIVAVALGAAWLQRQSESPVEGPPAANRHDPVARPPVDPPASAPAPRPADPRPSSPAPANSAPSSAPEPKASAPARREAEAASPLPSKPVPAAPPPPTLPPPTTVTTDGVWAFSEEAFEDVHAITCTAAGSLQVRTTDGVLDGTLRLKQECTEAKRAAPETTQAVAALTGGTVSGDAISFVTRTVDDRVTTTCTYEGSLVGVARTTMAGRVSCDARATGLSSQLTLRGTWRASRTSP